jgi:tRNA pseudouridine55 synthase
MILLDKPAGLGSTEALRLISKRHSLGPLGHSGTLDPAATGLLVVCCGFATRLVPRLQEGRKRYLAGVCFGSATDTCDATGQTVDEGPVPTDLAQRVQQALPLFLGAIQQVPPAYSAVKLGGQRAHDLARQGLLTDDQLEPREVTIHDLQLLSAHDQTVELDIVCSGGTYIRSLARDLGKAVGSPAHLGTLRRTETGGFSVAQARPLDELLATSDLGPHLIPPGAIFPTWTRHACTKELAIKLATGNGELVPDLPPGELLLTLEGFGLDGVFGLGRVEEGGILRMWRLLDHGGHFLSL